MHGIIAVIFIAIVCVVSGEAEVSLPSYRIARSMNKPYRSSSILNHGDCLDKTASSPSFITRVVRDSINFFDPDSNKFIYVANEYFNYDEYGRILSRDFHKVDKKYRKYPYVDTMKFIFMRDNDGNVTSQTVLFNHDASGKESIKEQFSNPVNDAALFYCQNLGEPNFFGFTCEISDEYSYLSSINRQKLDTVNLTWHRSGRDTVIKRDNNEVVVWKQDWDSLTNKFTTSEVYSYFYPGVHCVKITETAYSQSPPTEKIVYSGKFDENGNEYEETVEGCYWNDSASQWNISSSDKTIRIYNDHEDVVSSKRQDKENNCSSTNTCERWDYGYSYNNAGFIISRIDSAYDANESPKFWHKESHFFSYLSFPASIFPYQSIKNDKNKQIINLNGLITTKSSKVIFLYSISGKFIVLITISQSDFLWNLCRNQNIHVGKGLFIAKVPGINTSFRVWHE